MQLSVVHRILISNQTLISVTDMSTKVSRIKTTAECLTTTRQAFVESWDDFNSHFTRKDNLDTFSVSESWLNSSVNDDEVLNQAYNVYRTDRNLELTEKKDGEMCYKVTYFQSRT